MQPCRSGRRQLRSRCGPRHLRYLPGLSFDWIEAAHGEPAGQGGGRLPFVVSPMLELEIVAESDDGKALLIGEAKWSIEQDPDRLRADLIEKARNLPFAHGKNLYAAAWLEECPPQAMAGGHVIGPSDVVSALAQWTS